MTRRLVLAAVAIAACRPAPAPTSSPPPVVAPAPRRADCATAASILAADHRVRALPSLRATGSPRYPALLRTACRDDAWPAAYLACVVGGEPACDRQLDPTAQLRLAARRGVLEEALAAADDEAATSGDPAAPEALDACDALAADLETWASCPGLAAPLPAAQRDQARAIRADAEALRDPAAPVAARRDRVERCQRDGLALRRTGRRAGCPLAVQRELVATPPPDHLPASCALYTAAAIAHGACDAIAPAVRAQADAAMRGVVAEWNATGDGELRRRVRHRCYYFAQELWRDTSDAGCPRP